MKKKTFVIHDESVNRYGYRILTAGLDTAQFEKNPIGYYMHDRRAYDPKGDEVICKWENLQKLADGTITADAVFDEDCEKSMKIYNKIDKGFISMASISAKPIELSDAPEYLLQGQTRETVTKSELLEISIVDRGGNNNALIRLSGGEQKKDLPKLINNNSMNLESELRKVLKLADDADVVAQVKELQEETGFKKKFEDLSAQVQNERETEAIALVDQAVTDGIIEKEQKETFLNLFKVDHNGTKKALAAIKKPAKQEGLTGEALHEYVKSLNAGGKGDTKKDYAWYEQNDPKGLLKLKADNPEKFEELFNEHFKTE